MNGTAGNTRPILEVKSLSVSYGAVMAFEDVSFTVESGEFIAVIGPNGAGKSTLLKAIVGHLADFDGRITRGKVYFEDEEITGSKPYELIGKGISIVPEGRRVFTNMTVQENLEMGAYSLQKDDKDSEIERVYGIFPVLAERRKQRAGTLSGGEQQMLALGRSMVLSPTLLFLDEPSIGLSPNYVISIFDKLREINESGTTVFLVEQNARMALEYSRRALVFEIGKLAFEGPSKDLIEDDRVKSAFLGG